MRICFVWLLLSYVNVSFNLNASEYSRVLVDDGRFVVRLEGSVMQVSELEDIEIHTGDDVFKTIEKRKVYYNRNIQTITIQQPDGRAVIKKAPLVVWKKEWKNIIFIQEKIIKIINASLSDDTLHVIYIDIDEKLKVDSILITKTEVKSNQSTFIIPILSHDDVFSIKGAVILQTSLGLFLLIDLRSGADRTQLWRLSQPVPSKVWEEDINGRK